METAQNYQQLSPQRIGPVSQPFMEIPEDEEEGFSFNSLLDVVRRRALLIGLITTAVTGAVMTFTYFQKPVYRGSFLLLVEPVIEKGGNKLSGLASVAGNLGLGGAGSSNLDYESQLIVLQSPKIMNPIIQQLQSKYADITYKKLFGTPGQKAALSIGRIKKTKVIEIAYLEKDTQKIEDVLNQLANGYLQYSKNDRKSEPKQAITFIEEQLPQVRQRVDTLQAQLQQFRQQYQLIDPQVQGQQLAKQMVELENTKTEIRTSIVQQQMLSETLQQRLSGQTAETALIASALTQAPRYQKLLNDLKELRTRIELEQRRFTVNSPQIQDLLIQQAKLEPMIREEAEKVLGQNLQQVPIQQLERVPFQDSIRMQLAQELVNSSNQIEVLKIRSQAIDATINKLNQEVKNFPVVIRQFTDLQRELGVATNTLNQLLAQKESLRVDVAKEDVPWELISEPQIPKDKKGKYIAHSPSYTKRLAIGILGGLLLGVGTALLLDRLNNVFRRVDEVKDSAKFPLLGLIPLSDRAKQIPSPIPPIESLNPRAGYYGNSPFIEAFRSLNANLRLLSSTAGIRSLVISSPAPTDGKSTIASNLALAAAAMGQKVLLVDADLRYPQIHAKLGLPISPGLADLLATDMSPESIIQPAPSEENLSVISAGAPSADPLRLLSSKKMQLLMERWRSQFDLVIYDTPPLLGLADSSLLAGQTNGMLVVVAMAHTDKEEFKQALQGLQMAGTPVLGIVVNQVKELANAYLEPRRDVIPASHVN